MMKGFLHTVATLVMLTLLPSLQLFSQSVTITQPDQLTAPISGSTTICSGGSATITVVLSGGTQPWRVTYPGGSATNITGAEPFSFQFSTGTLSANTTYNSTNVIVSDINSCSPTTTGSAVVNVNPLPNGAIAGTTAVCQNGSNQLVTFTGSNGTAPYTFTYTINGGSAQTVTTSGVNNSVTVSQSVTTVGTYDYTLISVKDASSTTCSNAVSGQSITVTVYGLPSAPAAGDVTTCYDGAEHTGSATGGVGETIVWYTAPTGGSLTSAPSGTVSGTYTAYAASRNTLSNWNLYGVCGIQEYIK